MKRSQRLNVENIRACLVQQASTQSPALGLGTPGSVAEHSKLPRPQPSVGLSSVEGLGYASSL